MQKISFNEGWAYGHLGADSLVPVTLPHDAMLGEERREGNPGGKNACWYDGFDYEYVKKFFVPEEWKELDVLFEFEGVYRNAKVYINGSYAGGRAYGYVNFFIPAAGLKYGEENEIRVEAFNADQPNSRWYSGAGIYRPVWVYLLPKEHIVPEGIRITTLGYEQPRIAVEAETNAAGDVKIEILNGGRAIAFAQCRSEGLARAEIELPGAKLWSPESPYLYTCRVTFGEDAQEVKFGVRTLECDAKGGLKINGRRVILRGACIHHDNGILGAVNHPFADERKIRLLKKYGYNAIRSAHNPTSLATLEACDRLGVLVLDEYCDMWYIHKNKYDYADRLMDEWQGDLTSLVRRDYNHPSVVMYSLGNEVAETGQKKGIAFAAEMTKFIHTMDQRPVTCGINIFFNLLYSLGFGIYSDKKAESELKNNKKKKKSVGSEFFNDLAGLLGATTMKVGATLPGCNARTKDAFAAMDVAGYNYGILRYKGDFKRHPDRVILGSETFCSDARRFWLTAQKHPALIGDFVWAGIDYLGEVAVGSWEHADYAPDFTGGVGWMTAGSGRLDLNGRPLAEALYTRVAFDLDRIAVGVVRADKAFEKHSPSAWKLSGAWNSWSWDGCEGNRTVVEVYTTCPRAAIYINGRKAGEKKVGKDARACFKAVYERGELVAVGLDKDGNEVCRTSLESGTEKTVLTAIPERGSIPADGLCYIRLDYTDENGVWKPLARGDIKAEVEGGELVAFGNACPFNMRGYLSDTTDTYYGEALAIVRPSKGAEEIKLTASSPYGMASARVKVEPEEAK